MKFASFCFVILFAVCVCSDDKCSLHDKICLKDFFQNALETIRYVGIPAIDIPVLDPFKLADVTIPIYGLLNLTLVDGVAVGIGKCTITKYEIYMEEMLKKTDCSCDITIRGHYVITPAPILEKMCSWCNIHGDGNGTILLENWTFKIKYPTKLVERDGQIYLTGLFDRAEHEADVGNVTLEADGIEIGSYDVSKTAIALLNQIWQLIMTSDIGKLIHEKALQYFYDIHDKFYNEVPVNQYLIEDLRKFIN